MSVADDVGQTSGRVAESSGTRARVLFDGGRLPVDHFDWPSLVDSIENQLKTRTGPALAICSVNLDHLYRYRDVSLPGATHLDAGNWLYVADGWPVARQAGKASGLDWPRLAGADLLPQIMGMVHERAGSVALLGGTTDMHASFRATLSASYPDVDLAGVWAPDKNDLVEAAGSSEIDNRLRELDPDVVIVALPKPYSERWIAAHADNTSGRIYLPFGAAADFMSGHAQRAPDFMQRHNLEWLYRLWREPRRLARRYLIEAPTIVRMLRRSKVRVVNTGAAVTNTPASAVVRAKTDLREWQRHS